jgi:hypothetical protein
MARSQVWDLEGFFVKGNSLSMVGGFNFLTGAPNYPQYSSGDIFIAAGAKPSYEASYRTDPAGRDNHIVDNSYGYNFVLDLDFVGTDGGTYTVLKIDATAEVETAYYPQNEGSSPWCYVGGATATIDTGSFSFLDNLKDLETGFNGGNHYALTGFDLSFLDAGLEYWTHFTMGCGNDNLMGYAETAPVPEPSTFVLMGAGGGLLWLVRRRKSQK